MGCTAALAVSSLTGCGAGAVAGLGAIALLALTFAAACGGQALSDEDPTPSDAAAGGTDSGPEGSVPPDGAAPDQTLPDSPSIIDSPTIDVPQPDAGGCLGKCPSGMMCVTQGNGLWCVPDADRDELPDQQDNCPYAANPGQGDSDGDGMGDACDRCAGPNDTTSCGVECCNDPDGDGTPGTSVWGSLTPGKDNCPYIPNPSQDDADHDGIGDACDLCKYDPNPLSPCGDPCLDSDGDGVSDMGYCGSGDTDTCQFNPSDHFDDVDQDKIGDVCDPDGIAPLALRIRVLERLLRDGILDSDTVELASRAA